MIDVPHSDLRKALGVYQSPVLSSSQEHQLAISLPHRTKEEVVQILALCKELDEFSWGIAEAVRAVELDRNQALSKLKARYSFLDEEDLSRTLAHALYLTR